MNTPKVSIIVPVYNVEGYLERCLNSLVHQTLEEIEIIIVNDGSTDGSNEIMADFAARYPHKIKAFTQANSGVAAARNFALSQAAGEFVGFVDSDDFVRTDMYENLYERAMEEDADVVVSGYVRMNTGHSRQDQLNDMEQYGVSMEENPLLLVCGVPYLWNKIFKRTIIEENHIAFISARIFEDLVFTYECMLKAHRISKVNRAFYYYRVARTDSATAVFSRKMFDVFPAMDTLIAYYHAHTDAEKFRKYLLCTVLNHTMLRLEAKTDEAVLDMKLEFLDAVFAYLDSTFPDWKEEPFYFAYKGKDREAYTDKTYWQQILRSGCANWQEVRETETKLLQAQQKQQKQNREAKLYYKYAVKKMPVREKTVFIEPQQGKDMNGNMFYILKELHDNPVYKGWRLYLGVDSSCQTEFKQKLAFYHIRNVRFVELNTKKYNKILATAKYLFTDISLRSYFVKRPEQVYLNTWHGTPFKVMGRKVESEAYKIGNIQKNLRMADYQLYPSEFMEKVMLRDYMIAGTTDSRVLLTGYPRNTVFFGEPNARIRAELGLEGKEVIAYLPTWRGLRTEVEGTDRLETYLTQIEDRLTDNQVFYVNPHPFQKRMIDFTKFQKIRAVPQKYETYDFLNCADVLITDYSSVFFDFANTGRKIILFAYDEETYFSGRGVYFPFSYLPFTKVTTVDELMKAVREPKDYDDSAFREAFCKYDGADVTNRICNMMLQGQSAQSQKLLVRPVPDTQRKKVLIYAGSMRNDRNREALWNALFEADCEKTEYYVTFHQNKLQKNPYVLGTLPEGVRYLVQSGNPNVTPEEEQLLKDIVAQPKVYEQNQDVLNRIYREERQGWYDTMDFDRIINFAGMDPVELGVLSTFQGRKIMYVNVKKVWQAGISPKLYNKYDEIYVKNQDIYAKVIKYCNPRKVKIAESLTDILS